MLFFSNLVPLSPSLPTKGLVVMELSLNHVRDMSVKKPSLARFQDTEYMTRSRLVVSSLLGQCMLPEGLIHQGDLLTLLNGQPVATLEDFREHFLPEERGGRLSRWTLPIRCSKN